MELKISVGEYKGVETISLFKVISDGFLSGKHLGDCWLKFLCRLGGIGADGWDTFKQTFSTLKKNTKIFNQKLSDEISGEI